MPIKNYTTKIDVFKTIGEIQGCLVRHGARQIMQQYNDKGHPQALCFSIETPFGLRGVKLPANIDAVHRVLKKQKVKVDEEQAARVAWRIIKDWVDAQMAILESEMVRMDEIFLPYMIVNQSGETLYQLYDNKQLCLEGGVTMPSELKPCPECGAEMTIGYACGEYFVYPAGRGCWFCEGFNEMHSNDDYEKEVWNKHVDKHKDIIIGVDFAKDKAGERE